VSPQHNAAHGEHPRAVYLCFGQHSRCADADCGCERWASKKDKRKTRGSGRSSFACYTIIAPAAIDSPCGVATSAIIALAEWSTSKEGAATSRPAHQRRRGGVHWGIFSLGTSTAISSSAVPDFQSLLLRWVQPRSRFSPGRTVESRWRQGNRRWSTHVYARHVL
jgi:hypothetical protein